MINRYYILQSIFKLVILTVFVLIIANIESHYVIDHERIVIKYMNNNYLENFSEIEVIDKVKLFFSTHDSLCKDINTGLLEDLILDNKYLKKAEVYLDVGQAINIFLYFREPFVKILSNNQIHYYDYDLILLPDLSGFNKNLLVVTGDINKNNFHDLFGLLNTIYNNKMLNNLIGGVHYDSKTGYILSSKICDLKIGLNSDIEMNKQIFKNIELFSVFLFEQLGCDYCNQINLGYNNQIICVK